MRWIAGTLGLLLVAGPLHGQGFAVHSHSGCALARTGAGVAAPCTDGSAVFYNPAALASGRGVASAGMVAPYVKSRFTFDGTNESFSMDQGVQFLPHLWAAARLTSRIGAGVGVWAPYGGKTSWPLGFEGRYIAYKTALHGIYAQPTLAGELIPGRLALGIGLAVVRGSVEIRRRLDLATTLIPGTNVPFSAVGVPEGTDFADVGLAVDDWSATFNIGVQVRASDRWSLGARYLHTARLDLAGTADFRQIATGLTLPDGTSIDLILAPFFGPGAPLSDQRLTTGVTLPNQLVVGARFLVAPQVRLLLDYEWTGWAQFDEVVLDFANAPSDTMFLEFRNTSAVRLAVDIDKYEGLALRGSIRYSDAATPDVSVSPLLVEGQRITFAAGFGYQFTQRFHADAAAAVAFQQDRRGSVRPRTRRDQTAAELNVGSYSWRVLAGGITLSYLLGRPP